MIKFFFYSIAIAFPWISMFINDNPGGAIAALIMQCTIVGWPFASMWAIRVQKEKWENAKTQK